MSVTCLQVDIRRHEQDHLRRCASFRRLRLRHCGLASLGVLDGGRGLLLLRRPRSIVPILVVCLASALLALRPTCLRQLMLGLSIQSSFVQPLKRAWTPSLARMTDKTIIGGDMDGVRRASRQRFSESSPLSSGDPSCAAERVVCTVPRRIANWKCCKTNIRRNEVGQHQNKVAVRAPGVMYKMHLGAARCCLRGGKHATAGLPRRWPLGLRLRCLGAAQCLPLGRLGRRRSSCRGVSQPEQRSAAAAISAGALPVERVL